jgi:anti-sigma regulatory factor (Ser/Thr protein kinase)
VVSFAATPAALPQAAKVFRRVLDAVDVRGRARFQLELIFEEVVTNAIRYGYRDRPPGTISVSLTRDDDRVRVVFMDDGDPFDPLAQPEPVAPPSIEQAVPGGLGLVLVRRIATDLSYERTANDTNELTITVDASGGDT